MLNKDSEGILYFFDLNLENVVLLVHEYYFTDWF